MANGSRLPIYRIDWKSLTHGPSWYFRSALESPPPNPLPHRLSSSPSELRSIPDAPGLAKQPELLRKGRFDEIFFVDLPGDEARTQIFRIHLEKRHQEAANFDVLALVASSAGFSGAEIEQAIVSALHSVFARRAGGEAGATLDTAGILAVLKESPPLSVTMREQIAELRQWAEGRCVPAD